VLRRSAYRVVMTEDIDTIKREVLIRKPEYVFFNYDNKKISGNDPVAEIKKALVVPEGQKPGARRKTRVVAFSYSATNYSEQALKAGAEKYLTNPDPDAFIKVIQDLEHERVLEQDKSALLLKPKPQKPSLSDFNTFKF
ncbi:MAG: hypothetical protein PHS37_07880, partial [Candidatus Omnitrophica bacterium]|nr:hypothetical protein [Candidatus Omnitrophota bacterium]